MKKHLIFSALLAMMGLQYGCTSDAERKEQRQEAEEKIQRAEESGEDIKVDRDVIGDDEIEIE